VPSGAASVTPAPAGAPTSASGTPTAQETGGEENLRLGPDEPQPDWAVDNLRRTDPGVDQWPSEVLHDKSKKVLSDLLQLIGGSKPWSDEARAAVLAPEFRGSTALRPADLRMVFDDGGVRVWKPAGPMDEELHDGTPFHALLAKLTEPYEGGHCNTFFKIVRVHIDGRALGDDSSDDIARIGRFGTKVLVHLDGKSSEGLREQNMDWEVEWRILPDVHEVRIEAIHLEVYDEVWTRSPLFAEVGRTILGGNPSYAEELLVGVDDYAGHSDRMLGSPYLGMQGLAVGDLDGDGLDDLYVAQPGGLPNRVYLRRADGTAEDVTQKSRAGVLENTRGVLIADWDGDGDEDLLLALGAGLLTMRNDGKCVFGDYQLYKADSPGDIYSLSAADPDGDGDLDVYACRYATNGVLFSVPTPYHDADNGNTNLYFRNDGERFTEAADEVGFGSNNHKFSLASVWEDFDQDGDLDLFVANDFGRDNLFRNTDGHFEDVAGEVGADDVSAGMGASVADYDLDGDPDLYITNMFSSAGQRIVPQEKFMDGENPEIHVFYDRHARGNTLLANRGDGTFEDVTERSGVAVGGWGWGACFVDLNNDGFEDLYSPDGFLTNEKPQDL